jgi:hypothetical protein
MTKNEEILALGSRTVGQKIRISLRTLLVSVGMAVCLWLYVNLTRDYTVTLDVRVNIQVPEGYALEDEPIHILRTRVKGRGWQLLNAYVSAVPAYNIVVPSAMVLRLNAIQRTVSQSSVLSKSFPAIATGSDPTRASALPDTTLVKFDRSMLLQALQLPQAVAPLDIVPDSLVLNVGSIGIRKVPIIPRLNIRPRNGFIVTRVTGITPDSVELRSGKKVLGGISRWFTQSIDQHDVHEPFTVQIPLSDSLEDNVRRNKNVVSINVDVQQYADMIMYDIPVQVQSVPANAGLVVSTRFVRVAVRGGIQDLARLSQDDIRVVVSYEDMMQNMYGTVRPRIEMPPNIALMSVEPHFIHFARRIGKPKI